MNEKKRFIDRMKVELGEWEAKIDHLGVEASLGKMEARSEIEELKQKLREELRPLRSELKELSNETDEAWDDVADGFKSAWSDVKTAIKNAAARYRS